MDGQPPAPASSAAGNEPRKCSKCGSTEFTKAPKTHTALGPRGWLLAVPLLAICLPAFLLTDDWSFGGARLGTVAALTALVALGSVSVVRFEQYTCNSCHEPMEEMANLIAGCLLFALSAVIVGLLVCLTLAILFFRFPREVFIGYHVLLGLFVAWSLPPTAALRATQSETKQVVQGGFVRLLLGFFGVFGVAPAISFFVLLVPGVVLARMAGCPTNVMDLTRVAPTFAAGLWTVIGSFLGTYVAATILFTVVRLVTGKDIRAPEE